jgi:RecJ-like exonuclease
MKCTCNNCKGKGTIVIDCPECDGDGENEFSLEHFSLEQIEKYHSPELLGLKEDLIRAQKQARTLSEWKPESAASYANQLVATVDEINRQANIVQKNLR